MATKNITMKNHNGTTWDELYPKTVADQVTETASKRFTSDAEMAAKADKTNATNLADGLMSKADKSKLDGVAANANNYTHPASHPATMITGLATVATSGNYADLTSKPTLGTAAEKNTGNVNGNIPVIGADGKLDASIMPALAITDTFVVANQAAMLALTAEVGDVAVRTDLSKSFILKTSPSSTLANWQELLTPPSTVTSVAGKSGAVTLTSADVGLGNVTNESKATMLTSPALTGTPTAPTAAAATNTTQVATTAFVKAQGYAPLASPALTGSPTAPTATAGDNSTKLATTAFVQTAVQDVSSAMPKITVSATQPGSPAAGDFWYEIV
ncbi:hypothetical protein ABER98_01660 [Domibacillus aminovorans]|uniref:hypothetical protein n=1 Tax=Domibacillus aminovorans TaxID=29332 RepID=UPI003D23C02D